MHSPFQFRHKEGSKDFATAHHACARNVQAAIMETMREAWTDERLDDFRAETARRFDEVDRHMEAGFRRIDEDIRGLRSEMNQKFEGLQRGLIYGVIALSGSFIAGFAAMIGLIATQL
jgi:hypothetical protein